MSDPALRGTLVDLSLRVTALEQVWASLETRVAELEHVALRQDHVFEELDAGREQILLILHELAGALQAERERLDQALGVDTTGRAGHRGRRTDALLLVRASAARARGPSSGVRALLRRPPAPASGRDGGLLRWD